MQYYLAIDIGASSGRHILSSVKNGKIMLEEIYRFDNIQISKNGHDCWNMQLLYSHIIKGLQQCKELNKIPISVGIDTWAVDFVLIDKNGEAVSDAVAYRDSRTIGIKDELENILNFKDHYHITGIQYQPFNTIYQLLALKKQEPQTLILADKMLMIPDYLNYLLTGKIAQEYTNATSTALVNAKSKTWDFDLIEKLELPKNIFAPIHEAGEKLANFSPAIKQLVGFDCTVVLPATHDTGSAFLAVPAANDSCVYISSGTWSLLGVENKEPITNEKSMLENFTNEGGYEYRYRYLKNIMGLWMIQSVRRELNGKNYIEGKEQRTQTQIQYNFEQLCQMAKACSDFSSIIDVDDESFLTPQSMIAAIKAMCKKTNQKSPESIGEIMHCVYNSLAHKYKTAIDNLSQITGKTYTAINIVGGGSKDSYLNELCAKQTGLPVLAGPSEGTALGNAIVQMIVAGEFEDLTQARKCVLNSFEIKKY